MNETEILGTKYMSMFLMFAVCFLLIFFLRFLYGPKGILRKNLWKNIDENNDEKDKESDKKELGNDTK